MCVRAAPLNSLAGSATIRPGAIVTEYKFKIGRLVLFYPKQVGRGQLDAARGIYQIIRRLPPAEDGEFQYEIRSDREGHNRVAKESELTPA